MWNEIRLYLLSAAVFLVFDLFWLLVVSKKMYQQFIGHLTGEVRMGPAIIFYFLYLSEVLLYSFFCIQLKLYLQQIELMVFGLLGNSCLLFF